MCHCTSKRLSFRLRRCSTPTSNHRCVYHVEFVVAGCKQFVVFAVATAQYVWTALASVTHSVVVSIAYVTLTLASQKILSWNSLFFSWGVPRYCSSPVRTPTVWPQCFLFHLLLCVYFILTRPIILLFHISMCACVNYEAPLSFVKQHLMSASMVMTMMMTMLIPCSVDVFITEAMMAWSCIHLFGWAYC